MTPRCSRCCCTSCGCRGSDRDDHEPGPTPWRGDKAYSSRAIRTLLRERGIGACIPEPDDQKGHRKRRESRGGRPPAFDAERLPRTQRRRARLQPGQAVARPGHPLRQARHRLPGRGGPARGHPLAQAVRRHALGPAVGYWVAPWARNQGYAAEAARALADWALDRGAPRVHLTADVANVASQSVARRAGFLQEGVIRSSLPYRDGSRGDAALFSRLPGD